jgi:hypothetical protein
MLAAHDAVCNSFVLALLRLAEFWSVLWAETVKEVPVLVFAMNTRREIFGLR